MGEIKFYTVVIFHHRIYTYARYCIEDAMDILEFFASVSRIVDFILLDEEHNLLLQKSDNFFVLLNNSYRRALNE